MKRLLSLIVLTAMATPAFASSFTITLAETGGNVVATGSGTIDTANLIKTSADTRSPGLEPDAGMLVVGTPGSHQAADFVYFSGPSSFGPGGSIAPDSGTGSLVGIRAVDPYAAILVPITYVSDTFISGSATWNDQTFSSLGVTPGTYVWTWDSGQDSLTITTKAVPVPEPVAVPALLLGLTALVIALRPGKFSK